MSIPLLLAVMLSESFPKNFIGQPPVEVDEDFGKTTISINLEGHERKDLKMDFEPGKLKVSAHTETTEGSEQTSVTISLDQKITGDQVEATFVDETSTLYVVIPNDRKSGNIKIG